MTEGQPDGPIIRAMRRQASLDGEAGMRARNTLREMGLIAAEPEAAPVIPPSTNPEEAQFIEPEAPEATPEVQGDIEKLRAELMTNPEVENDAEKILRGIQAEKPVPEPAVMTPESPEASEPVVPEPEEPGTPQAETEGERSAEQIANDIITANKKKGAVNETDRNEAKGRLKKDNLNIDAVLAIDELDMDSNEGKIELGSRRASLRDLGEAIKTGEVTEEQKEVAEKIGFDLVDYEIVVKKGKSKETAADKRQDLMDPAAAQTRIDEIVQKIEIPEFQIRTLQDLAKGKPLEVQNLIYKKIAELKAAGGEAGRGSPERAMAQFEVIKNRAFPDARSKFQALRDWMRTYSTVIPEEQLREMSEYYKGVEKEALRPEGLEIPGTPAEIERLRAFEADNRLEQKKALEAQIWLRWGRNQLSEYLDISKQDILTQTKGNDVFRIEINTPLQGRSYTSALPHMPTEVKKLLESEQRMVFETRGLYFAWYRAHQKFGTLASAMESGYLLPTNAQIAPILNRLCSETQIGVEGAKGGSEQVAKAVRLYYEMAIKGTGKIITRADGSESVQYTKLINGRTQVITEPVRRDEDDKLLFELKDGRNSVWVHNIFNTLLDNDAIAQDKAKVAQLCGGSDYYQELGLVVAKFMGFAARGYDNTTPAVRDMDILGRMIWSAKINYWKVSAEELKKTNEKRRAKRQKPLTLQQAEDEMFSGKADYIWLPREISSYFVEVDDFTGEYKLDPVTGKNIPIECATDVTTMARPYYMEPVVGEEYRMIKAESKTQKEKAKAQAESGDGDFVNYVLSDQLHKINWYESNFGIIEYKKFYEGQGYMSLYKMFDELAGDKEVAVSLTSFGGKAQTISIALAHVGDRHLDLEDQRVLEQMDKKPGFRTRDYVGYLYIFSLLHRHSPGYQISEKGAESSKNGWSNKRMGEVIDLARDSKLISAEGARRLKKEFKIGLLNG